MTTEAQDRMARVRSFRGARPPAHNDIIASELAQDAPVGRVSRDQEFAARNSNRRIETEEVRKADDNLGITGDDPERVRKAKPEGLVITSGRRPDRVRMWKPTPNGASARIVPVTAIQQNLDAGWTAYCPDCGGDHEDVPNICPEKPKVKYTFCPVCEERTPIYDNYLIGPTDQFEEEEKDPNFVVLEAFKRSTPEARIEAGLLVHMWARHPQETRAMGIAPLPEPSLTVLESLTQTTMATAPLEGALA